jgi:3-methyladenine DNA glycosylase AlkD
MGAKSLSERLRSELARVADPRRAPKMQAYMKSEMPYLGVASTPMRATAKEVLEAHPVERFEQWEADVRALWHGAKFREERYAALMLCGDQRAKAFQTMRALPLYEELITTGAWWDLVDELAAHRLGELLRNAPAPMKKAMRAWSRSPELWKRRSAMLCQLKLKEQTDLELLYDCIEPSLQGPKESPLAREFFIRKAIGWVLRQYAWTDPKEVKRYVEAHRDRLSGLSIREALKNV